MSNGRVERVMSAMHSNVSRRRVQNEPPGVRRAGYDGRVSKLEGILQSIQAGAMGAGILLLSSCDSRSRSEPGADLGLEPLPSGIELGCVGPEHNGDDMYSGRCCASVACAPPEDGACNEDAVTAGFGSGACLCGAPVRGPFAIDEADPTHGVARQDGPCCYVVSSIGCEGRPLHIDEQVRVASVVHRADWC